MSQHKRYVIFVALAATLSIFALYEFDASSTNSISNLIQQQQSKSASDQSLTTFSTWFQRIADLRNGFFQNDSADESSTETPIMEKSEPICKFPPLLADDPLIKPYLRNYASVRCSNEKNWVFTIGDGRFYIDDDAIQRHGMINCDYYRIDRIDEYNYNETPLGNYENGSWLSGDSFHVRCKAEDGKVYDNIHVSVTTPNHEIQYRIKTNADRLSERKLHLNVLVYLMDSVSRINFVRKLPKFYDLLTNTMDAQVMEGFNIVGDGTPWAVIPMLTGHFQTELPEARNRFANASFVDNWPFLFKNYTSAGYVTSYAEEQPLFSAFTYKLKGFELPPVDFYLRTMLLVAEKEKTKHKHFCLGDTPRSILWCNFWRELQTMYRPLGGKQFSFMFSSELSHDDYNTVQALDEHWTRAFGDLYRQDFLNDTLLIIMGDHGRRFGPVRQTQTGKLEEKLPFLAAVVPKWFRERFPASYANLKLNRNRLVTAFDLYATFMHLLDFQEDGGRGDLEERGLSLFREIPAERTCAHAHIKAHFCGCLDWQNLDNLSDPIVIKAVQKVIDLFNDQIEEMSGRCANLTLGKMVSARLLKPNDQLMAFKESLDFDNYTPDLTADKDLSAVIYQIRFITEPGGGDWEASMTYYFKENKFKMSQNDISRLNAYHHQASCVIDSRPHLRTFCYCL